jgi:mRNA-degrading endonuclease RelE of RelBE toxin-antitoxin system
MWLILEHRDIKKACRKLPKPILMKYELWKDLVFRHGPDKLREFPGFYDEKLTGERRSQRSSRLSRQYRVIYSAEKKVLTVHVVEITPHDY